MPEEFDIWMRLLRAVEGERVMAAGSRQNRGEKSAP